MKRKERRAGVRQKQRKVKGDKQRGEEEKPVKNGREREVMRRCENKKDRVRGENREEDEGAEGEEKMI